MALKKHQFYIYYDSKDVYARMEDRHPIKIKTFKSSQEAHDYVQSIVNPEGFHHSKFGEKGFLSDEFQNQISKHCEAIVRSAYGDIQ